MTSYARLKPFYVTLNIRNPNPNAVVPTYTLPTVANGYSNGIETSQTVAAVIDEVYAQNLVDKASDFLVAVERMELSLNGIPFYDARNQPVESIIVRSREAGHGEDITTLPITHNAYSLTHLFTILSQLDYEDAYSGVKFFVRYFITKDGFIRMNLSGTDFNTIQIEFPPRLNQILGINTLNQPLSLNPFEASTEAASTYPRLGMGDNFDHVLLRTNLPTYSDTIGNEKIALLTDFGIPMGYATTVQYGDDGLTEQSATVFLRDKLIYTPTERRFLELNGDFPINNIFIAAYYRSNVGTAHAVELPYGGSFEIKLGFYLRQ